MISVNVHASAIAVLLEIRRAHRGTVLCAAVFGPDRCDHAGHVSGGAGAPHGGRVVRSPAVPGPGVPAGRACLPAPGLGGSPAGRRGQRLDAAPAAVGRRAPWRAYAGARDRAGAARRGTGHPGGRRVGSAPRRFRPPGPPPAGPGGGCGCLSAGDPQNCRIPPWADRRCHGGMRELVGRPVVGAASDCGRTLCGPGP